MDSLVRKRAHMLLGILIVYVSGLVWAVWTGENESGIGLGGIIGGFVLMGVVVLLGSGVANRVVLGVTMGIVLVAGGWLGAMEVNRAYNECLVGGEGVRDALESYRGTHGEYPESLSDLQLSLPGRRALRGSILRYSRTGAWGYHLEFRDWMMSQVATERRRFSGHK